MSIRMELSRILVRENAESHVVELREVQGDRIVPIIIGQNEVAAIERGLLGQVPPRPMTHELLANVIESLGASLQGVQITDLQDQTFFARLVLRQGDRVIHVDCRPSDALALLAGAGDRVGGTVESGGGGVGGAGGGGGGGMGGVGGVEVAEHVVEQVVMSDSLPPNDPASMEGLDDSPPPLPDEDEDSDEA